MRFTNICIHFIGGPAPLDIGPTENYQMPWKERSNLEFSSVEFLQTKQVASILDHNVCEVWLRDLE
jgi:hypothetical protein